VQDLVSCELHGTLGQLLIMEGEADEARLGLSTAAGCCGGRRRRKPTTRPPEMEGNGFGQCAILRSFLERKERSGDSPEAANRRRAHAASLFTEMGNS
jgi:hypothetical protein